LGLIGVGFLDNATHYLNGDFGGFTTIIRNHQRLEIFIEAFVPTAQGAHRNAQYPGDLVCGPILGTKEYYRFFFLTLAIVLFFSANSASTSWISQAIFRPRFSHRTSS